MNGLLNLNYYSDDDSDNEDNQTSNKSSKSINGTVNTDSPGLFSLVNYNNDDDSDDDNTDNTNNNGDVIIYSNNISNKKRKTSEGSVDKLNVNSPKPKKSNSLFASLIRRKANSVQKQKNTSKVVSNSDSTSDAESGMNPSLAISQLINNTLNNEDSSLKIINLHDTERTYALKKRIYDLLNPSEKETQSDKTSASIENTERKTDNDNNVENKESGNENEMDIDKVEKIENNIDDLKLNLEEYGLPKETDDKCDQELQNRFSEWRYKKAKGLVFDKTFEKNNALEDPFIIRNLIDSLGIKEIGSNFAKDRFDPSVLPKSAHYKELYKQNTAKVQIQTVQVPVQLPNQGGTIGVVPGIQFVPSNMPKTSGIDLAEVSAKIQQQIKDAAAKAAAASANVNKISASLSSSLKPNNIPVTITNAKNSTTTATSSGHVKKSKWDMQ